VSPARPRTSLRVLLASALAILIVAAIPGGQAHAQPSPEEVEAQIKQLWLEAEPLIEEYNGIHEQFKANEAKQAELMAKIAPLETQVELARVRVGAIAAEVYKGGDVNAFNSVLSSGSPKELAERLMFLEQLAEVEDQQLQDVNELLAEYDVQKAPIDALVETLAKQDAELTAKKTTIEARLAELQKLRQDSYGSTGGTGSYRPWPCPATYEPTNGYKAAAFACAQAGKPYLWAADGPSSYDCSGLTLAAWKQVGVYLPHQSAQQRRSIPYVNRADLKLGDLVFYYNPIHHVGVYVGDNKIMHAPAAGERVHMEDMDHAGPIHSFGRPG
jgi:cell wall-associated NlpC family hydrolase